MIEQPDENDKFANIAAWVVVNMFVFCVMGYSIYFGFSSGVDPSVTKTRFFIQVLEIAAGVSAFGGGAVIAVAQWIFLRRLIPQITGGGWVWVIAGMVSSICSLFVLPFLIVGLGDYPKEIDYLFFTVLMISGQVIFLSIVQGLILNANKYKRSFRWVLVHIVGYSLMVITTFYLWNDQIGVFIVEVIILMTMATGISAWEFLRIRASRVESKGENPTPQATSISKSTSFVQANLENRDLSAQNFDGADFRNANLRMANLEKISGEPIKVRKMGPGCFSLILTILSEGRDVGNMNYAFIKDEMKSTDFSGADLSGARLNQARLREANFRHAIAKKADFSEAVLINADLSEADLGYANLSNADLSDAMFFKTDLAGADLTGAKLGEADFERANLRKAIMRNIDLRSVRYLDRADLTDTDLTGALLPDSMQLPA